MNFRKLATGLLSAALAALTLTSSLLHAQTFQSLHTFENKDGGFPWAKLIQASDGNFYGTTQYGGTNTKGFCGGFAQDVGGGCGTVFKISPSGVLTTLHSFNGLDGSHPSAGLIQGASGNFYGTTLAGGTGYRCPSGYAGCGTIFKITPEGVLTTLYIFNYFDGQGPAADLILGRDGFLYGTTTAGGPLDLGTIFRIDAKGRLTTLHFLEFKDGCAPQAGLIQSTDGNLYGTAFACGSITLSAGSVFKITPAGSFSTLHIFGGKDGANPQAALIQARDGNFYGTTEQGGTNEDPLPGPGGTVFKITPGGTLTTLHSFYGPDGDTPTTPLLEATDGDFYGGAAYSTSGYGTLFKITPAGTFTTVHSFDYTDGAFPYSGLLQGTDGNFYAGAFAGGDTKKCLFGCGTIFSMSFGLPPFIQPVPAFGVAGSLIKILGNNLMSTTSVVFNGKATAFKVVSSSEITADVPYGATSGKVQVTTLQGTLKSNVVFEVRQ